MSLANYQVMIYLQLKAESSEIMGIEAVDREIGSKRRQKDLEIDQARPLTFRHRFFID